jgi:hypothetical protein
MFQVFGTVCCKELKQKTALVTVCGNVMCFLSDYVGSYSFLRIYLHLVETQCMS